MEILKEGEPVLPVAQILRKHGVSRYVLQVESEIWGASIAELKCLKELEAENSKLKRMFADLVLENEAIKGDGH